MSDGAEETAGGRMQAVRPDQLRQLSQHLRAIAAESEGFAASIEMLPASELVRADGVKSVPRGLAFINGWLANIAKALREREFDSLSGLGAVPESIPDSTGNTRSDGALGGDVVAQRGRRKTNKSP